MSRRSLSPHQDPYNVQDDYAHQQHSPQLQLQQQQQTQTQHHYLDDVDQIAYDSMSTILEVDSEGTNSETSDRLRHFDSPLHIETPRTPEPRTATLESTSSTATSNATNDRLSPVSDLSPKDKFSGIISALAEQMERLQTSKPALAQQTERNRPSSRQIESRSDKYELLEDGDDDDATRPPSGDSSNSSSQGHQPQQLQQQDASTSPSTSENNSQLNSPSPSESPRPGSSPRLVVGNTQQGSTNVQQEQQKAGSSSNLASNKSRATSAESLMMITVSPMVSPKVKFPILKHAKQTSNQIFDSGGDYNDERKIIEVSNKSTITAIDLTLMDKMVQKYFVETRDKATQSIKFDCDDEFDTLEFNDRDGSFRRRTGAGSGGGSRRQVKSVAVGTEKFSRERFSLLPPTKTRSTQTKSNVDNDIGASETRRFKLAHLDIGSLRQQRPQTKGLNSEVIDSTNDGDKARDSVKNSLEEGQSIQKIKPKTRATPSPSRRSKTPIEERTTKMDEKATLNSSQDSLVDSSKPQINKSSQKKEQSKDSLSPPANITNLENSSQSNSESSSNQNNQQMSSNDSAETSESLQQMVPTSNQEKQRQIDSVPKKQDLERAKKIEKTIKVPENNAKPEHSSQWRALIPSVKTELRVIIEIQDTKQRQRSEILSDSQFIDGKLSKKTQVNTSKHVAATPREVLNRLQTVGRESSLLYQDPKQRLAEETIPSSVAAATNKTALRWSSSPHNTLQNGSSNHQSTSSTKLQENVNYNRAFEGRNWREVSRSSVVNEIETKTRQKSDNKLDGILDNQDSDIIMTSDALINHMANDKSAIELRSRAAQRYESHERDPRTGELVKTGKLTERTLVESEAGFNDDHAQNSSEKIPDNDPSTKARHRERQQTTDAASSSGRGTPIIASSKLLENVTDQHRRMKSEREESTSAPSHQRAPIATAPRRQQSTIPNEQETRQRPEQWASQSTPNIRTTIPQFERKTTPILKLTTPPIKKQASIEIEEESEDRQQVVENGRLVYDDRLRERKYESQRTSSPSLNVNSSGNDNNLILTPDMRARESHRSTRSSSMSPRSPILGPAGGILRNRGDTTQDYQSQPSQVASQQRAQLLKPFSLRPSVRNTIDSPQAPIMFADQTSNLSASSDPETMDSGFAQSGAGSSSVLNQRAGAPSVVSPHYHPITVMPSSRHRSGMQNTSSNSPDISRPIERQQRVPRDQKRSSSNFEARQEQLEEPISLNFVDDDVDELIDQLDFSPTARRSRATPDYHKQQQIRQASHQKMPQRNGQGK